MISSGRGVNLGKRPEQLMAILLRDSDPCVCNLPVGPIGSFCFFQPYLQPDFPVARKFAGVCQEAKQALPQASAIGKNAGSIRNLLVPDQSVSILGGQWLDGIDQVPHKTGDVDKLHAQLDLSRLNFGEIENIVDQCQEVVSGAADFSQHGPP